MGNSPCSEGVTPCLVFRPGTAEAVLLKTFDRISSAQEHQADVVYEFPQGNQFSAIRDRPFTVKWRADKDTASIVYLVARSKDKGYLGAIEAITQTRGPDGKLAREGEVQFKVALPGT